MTLKKYAIRYRKENLSIEGEFCTKIWEISAVAERYDSLRPENGYTYEEMMSFDGRSHKDDWTPRKVVPNINPKKNPKFGDYSSCMGTLVFSQRAIEKLYDLIKDDVEILPLECDYGEFSIINVTTILDAIDHENSEYEYIEGTRKIMYFKKYVFFEDVVKGHDIFTITDKKGTYFFVSDGFVQTVERSKLKGFRFELAWDSEAPTTI